MSGQKLRKLSGIEVRWHVFDFDMPKGKCCDSSTFQILIAFDQPCDKVVGTRNIWRPMGVVVDEKAIKFAGQTILGAKNCSLNSSLDYILAGVRNPNICYSAIIKLIRTFINSHRSTFHVRKIDPIFPFDVVGVQG